MPNSITSFIPRSQRSDCFLGPTKNVVVRFVTSPLKLTETDTLSGL